MTNQEKRWQRMAADFLTEVTGGKVLVKRHAQLALMLEQEYKRGYIKGHDDGWIEGAGK